MKQYRVKAIKYNESGALTNEVFIKYFNADEEEQAKNFYNDYNSKRYDDKPTIKMYKMELSILAYKKITDVEALFNLFEA